MKILAIAMATAALLVSASAAQASDAGPTEQFAKRLFAVQPAAKGKTYACFVRRYDAAHLAKHPKQKVTQMSVLVTAAIVPEDKALNYAFALGVQFRDRKGHYQSSGDCGHPVASQASADKLGLGCGVDCDGGGLSIELVNSDKSVLVSIERISIWDNAKQDEDRVGFDAGPDDKVFRLDRANIEQCRPLMGDDDKAATM